MLEGIVTIIGLCIIFIPIIMYINYLLKRIKEKTKFDEHLEIVKDKKGTLGVLTAYAERVLYGLSIICIGVLLSVYFRSDISFNLVIISITLYIIVKWIDEKNEK